MLDHLVGKPSSNWKRAQVLLTLVAGSWVLARGRTARLPKRFQTWSRSLDGRAPWKIALASWMTYYLLQNLFHLVGLNAPEPLARLYKRSFYRATWILTALDAGFFTAMSLRPTWLRHLCSILFSAYYLIFADAADEKVRRVRATMSVDQMRLSWQKGADNPILAVISRMLRPRLTIEKMIMVPRPEPRQHLPPIELHLYYAGDPATLSDHRTVLLQFPGGGFVCMPPACHGDTIAAWAKQTGLPVCSVNYGKAPEHPYPWAIEECFDLYCALIESRGKIIGLTGSHKLNVVALGDSAGGNVVAAMSLKIIAHNEEVKSAKALSPMNGSSFYVVEEEDGSKVATQIPLPVGLILIYPALDFEMSCWMSPAQLSLVRAESKSHMLRSNSLESLWQSKDHFSHVSPLSVVPDIDQSQSLWKRVLGIRNDAVRPATVDTSNAWASSRLAMTSRMSFFNDRVISPDMMRAMAILYLGPHAYPAFESDYLLSPIVAPLELLAQFPKTYMICGEKDPLVDDTVIFAGRIRQAKQLHAGTSTVHPNDTVRVKFLEGISHAFLQMMAFLPEAQQATRTIGDWVQEMTHDAEAMLNDDDSDLASSTGSSRGAMPVVTDVVDHVAEIVTTENAMLHRRKQQLVHGLFSNDS